ncbi:hypothetical protein AB0J86_22475 [Micromonospora sp. NPDC049559]|uniref:hypothetical protein n=1 Tax=Micromonospora sp. NPDC049559 TaxID=3155923 RepID=UPI00343737E6
MDTATRPIWSTVEPGWPVRSEQVEGVTLGVPEGWRPEAATPAVGGVTERAFTGRFPGELLAVAVMPEADPTHNLRLWVDATIALIGLPHPALAPAGLLEWAAEGEQVGWAADLGVDTCLTYQGVLGDSPNLNRCYVVLARRGTTAWRIVLSLASAMLPGSPDEGVTAQDHVRAAAVFGGLRLG